METLDLDQLIHELAKLREQYGNIESTYVVGPRLISLRIVDVNFSPDDGFVILDGE